MGADCTLAEDKKDTADWSMSSLSGSLCAGLAGAAVAGVIVAVAVAGAVAGVAAGVGVADGASDGVGLLEDGGEGAVVAVFEEEEEEEGASGIMEAMFALRRADAKLEESFSFAMTNEFYYRVCLWVWRRPAKPNLESGESFAKAHENGKTFFKLDCKHIYGFIIGDNHL